QGDQAREMEDELDHHDEERVAGAEEGLREDHADGDDGRADPHEAHGEQGGVSDGVTRGEYGEQLGREEDALEDPHRAENEEAQPDGCPAETRGAVSVALTERLGNEGRSAGSEGEACGESELQDADDDGRGGAVYGFGAASGAARCDELRARLRV